MARFHNSCAALVLAWLAAVSMQAHAQPALNASQQDKQRPWARGVSQREQAIALEIYGAANQEFAELRFTQALAKYREALRHWDHPGIRFNMAMCLMNLDQPVEASEQLERGMRYGAAALGVDAYAQGTTYRKLLDAQLVRLKVACTEAGAKVSIDGKLLFTGPGTIDQVMLPGEHQVVATKDGFHTTAETFVLVAGKPTTYEIRPLAEPRLAAAQPCNTTPPHISIPSTPTTSRAAAPSTVTQPPSPPVANTDQRTQSVPLAISLQGNGSMFQSIAPTAPTPSAPATSTRSQGSTAFSWRELVRQALTPTPPPSAATTPTPATSTEATAPQPTAPQPTAAPTIPSPAPGTYPPPSPLYPPPGYQPPPMPQPTWPQPPTYPSPQPAWSQPPTYQAPQPPVPQPPSTPTYRSPTPTSQAPQPPMPQPPTYASPLPPVPQPPTPQSPSTPTYRSPTPAPQPPQPPGATPTRSQPPAPPSTYRPPTPTYQPPAPPAPTYRPPTPTYTPPASTYRPPTPTYAPPASTYRPPTPTYTPPPTYRH
jgi:hypothetical protein